ncbi:CST complex subunit STN1-like [Diorhabda sublineata]|uniref:CST complex subunit STN1-like n=1 Tax=Diorhabda sublineata TaxID=1163346 RepID=UPI0024E0D88F|nr:CST complex subunit STN1-like [Diorhabda sublineata]
MENNTIPEDSNNWLIIKNEQGFVKTATCEENETQVYDKTRDWVVTECDSNRQKFNENIMVSKNIAKFFIRDFLDAKEVNGCFIHKNIEFTSVYICGQVVDKYASSEYYFIDVDDGTSSIKCLISMSNLAYMKQSNKGLETCRSWMEENKHTETCLLKAARVLMSSFDYMQRSIPDFHELQLGDTVQIIGTLREYTHGRNVFIKRINRELYNPLIFMSHLEEMIYLYREVYSQE